MLDPTYHEERGHDWNLQTDGSRLLERSLEYQFLGLLTGELLRRKLRFEVLRGDVDLDGHDLIVEADGIMRHIQLKAVADGGKTRRVPINIALASKPSACVIWMNYDPHSLAITGWRWFGGVPRARLPDLGGVVGKQSRANRQGIKAARPNTRILPARSFISVPDIATVADCLFGHASLLLLRQHLRGRTIDASWQPWLSRVREGEFQAIPKNFTWIDACDMAHLVDYDLAESLGLGDPTEYQGRQLDDAMKSGMWRGDAAELWLTLFLEHRRWRFSSPFEPDPEMLALLDTLVRQLRHALTGEIVK